MRTSSRLLDVLWVIQAAAIVAEPPTSAPSTPVIPPTNVASISSRSRLTSRFDDLLHDLQLFRLQRPLSGPSDEPHTNLFVVAVEDVDAIIGDGVMEGSARRI